MMHRQTIEKMCQAAKVKYAKSTDPDCPNCWFIWDSWPVYEMPEWVPNWINGVNPEALYNWMLEESRTNQEVRQAMLDAGMRPRGRRAGGADLTKMQIGV